MKDTFNKAAWFASALAILTWAFAPQIASANAVMFPKIPSVEVLPLPPVSQDRTADPGH
ncbi:hypothetical protein [Marivita geojedonensis]|jgi:hypothetical protein|uniref:hypothetical protein n=1 Tax=Marivita geojedonensis TaxID=1123756 RepID=UPI000D4328E9|nr:hypothetical protein [Marivita geojedonensis]PRY78603.1 hypothetical protein CLV76_106163 [Marivita geojedonensis]